MAAGRPTSYTPELGKLICERVATNPVGLETLLILYPDMPNHSTIKAWRKQFSEFSAWYLEAKSFQAQLLVEEIDELLPSEVRYYHDAQGNERIDAPSAAMIIAKINNRKWTAARLAPKIYGDKQQNEVTASATSVEEIAKRVAEINTKSEKDY